MAAHLRGTKSYLNGVIDVACPTCNAQPGQRCMNTAAGLQATTAHLKRVNNANQDALQRPDVGNDSTAS